MIKEKTIDDVMRIDAKAIADALGGIPPERMHCSVLAELALKKTIQDYLDKNASARKG
jgi:nitrogen fixation NifU-like protein